MRRRAAIFTALTLAALVISIAFDEARVRKPPSAPPDAGDDASGPVPAVPATEEPSASQSGSDAAGTGRESRPPVRGELVLVDGSTGLPLRSEPITFSRRTWAARDRVPSLFVASGDRFEFSGPISVFSERVRLVAVVWPELDLIVTVEEADGSPARGAKLTDIRVAGRLRPFRASRIGASGAIRVSGLPWMREEPFSIAAKARESGAGAEEGTLGLVEEVVKEEARSGFTGLRPEDGVRVRIRLPPREDPAIRDAKVSDHNETDNDLPFEESLGRLEGPRPPTELRVRVLRANGSPAARTLVKSYLPRPVGGFRAWALSEGRTDANGVARLWFGKGDVIGLAVREAGFLFGDPILVSLAGESTTVTLREAPGADLQVFVVDGEDRPLPGARITVDLDNWVWLENGVQRFGLFTGPDGGLRLPRLPIEKVTIRARYGSRRATVSARPPGRAVLKLARRE